MIRLIGLLAMPLLFVAAHAADLPAYKPASQASSQLLPHGFYLSVGVGEIFTGADAGRYAFASKGLAGDVRAGYDALLPGTKIVAGLFAGVGVQDVSGAMLSGNERWNWEAGGRLGRVFNTSDLVYVLAAYRQQHLSWQDTGINAALDGVKTGGGVEFTMSNGVMLGFESAYTWYDTSHIGELSARTDDLSARVSLGLRF